MSTPNIANAVQVHAAGRVAADGTLAANAANVTSVTRSGAGVYVVVLGTEIDILTRTISVQCATTSRAAQVVTESDTGFTVNTFDLATPTAADSIFYFEVKRHSNG